MQQNGKYNFVVSKFSEKLIKLKQNNKCPVSLSLKQNYCGVICKGASQKRVLSQ